MEVAIKVPRGNTAVPIMVVGPDGRETIEFYRHSCELVFFEPGTKVYMYEPVELVFVALLEVKDDANSEEEDSMP